MSQGTSGQRLKRKPREEKTARDSKLEKEEKLNSTSLSTNVQKGKQRGGSLSRNYPTKIQESPKKSHSVDRNQATKLKSNPGTITVNNYSKKIPPKNPSKPNTNAVSKKGNVNILTKNTKSESKSVENLLDKKRNDQKKKSYDKSSKGADKKTNVQIAKSFIKNTQSKSKKLDKQPDIQKSSLKETSSANISQELELLNFGRPRTSTIHKKPPDIERSDNEVNNEFKGIPTLSSERPSSRNKAKLNGESDEDKASYEEDFEDYDSDFEESDTGSVSESDSTDTSAEEQEEILQDIQSEENINDKNSLPNIEKSNLSNSMKMPIIKDKNYLKMSDRSSLYTEKTVKDIPEVKPIKLSRSYINFQSAIEQKEIMNNNQSLNDTSNELNESDNTLQDELKNLQINYNRNIIQKVNLKQVFVQTEHCDEEEIQTDDIEIANKWTQYPTNGTSGYGGDKMIIDEKEAAWKSLFNVHSTKLSTFLQKTSNIILTILDEEFADIGDNYKTKVRHDLFYSDGYYVLSPIDLLSNAPVVNVYCSECSSYIITIHGNMVEIPLTDAVMNEKGIICIWNILDSKNPEYILTTNSQPTCGTFGPGFSDIVIAGMVDGAIVLWDLTELSSNHLQIKQDVPLTLRSPTYNTALVLGQDNHNSCIVAIQSVSSNSKENWRSTGFSGSSKNFHVVTLEDMGVINIWVVVEVLKPDISGIETDLGLAPGGKYRLVRSSCIPLYNLATLPPGQKLSIRTFDFRLIPFDSSRMLVTTDAGIILHVTRHSGSIEPRFYASELDSSSEVRCIDCSPHNEDIFLAGCNDGSIKMYNTKLVRPLMEFLHAARGEPVNLIKWSVVHPTVFCVLSSSSHIHFWNTMENSVHPLHSYHFDDCKVTWFAFKNVERNSSNFTSTRFSNFIIAKENGEVEVHTFQVKVSEQEYMKQLEYMKNL